MNRRGVTLLQLLVVGLVVFVLGCVFVPLIIGLSPEHMPMPGQTKDGKMIPVQRAEQDITTDNLNPFARSWGGKMTVTLPSKYEVLYPSWKGDSLWLMLRDKTTGELVYREVSTFGVLQGEIKFKSKD